MIGVASPSFCFRPFTEMIEQIASRFELWEVLVEERHAIDTLRGELSAMSRSYDLRFQIHAPMTDVNIGSMYEPMRRAAVRNASNCKIWSTLIQ